MAEIPGDLDLDLWRLSRDLLRCLLGLLLRCRSRRGDGLRERQLVRELYYKCTLLSLKNRIKEYLLLLGDRLRLQLGEKSKKSLKIISRTASFPSLPSHPSATPPELLFPISVFGLLHMDLLRAGLCSEQEFSE